jgi:MOSC domain-containing protein YiiM
MRTFEELQELWDESPPLPRGRGEVQLITVRRKDGGHRCPESIRVTRDGGVEGDRWALDPERELGRQVTLMTTRAAELVAAGEQPLDAVGDNFLVDLELAEEVLPAGTRIRLGSALLEVSEEPHLGCKKFSERFGPGALRWVNLAGNRSRRVRGVNCRVIEDGVVAVGDPVQVIGFGTGEPPS